MSAEKILLVDDNKGQRITLESILKSSGFQVISADCGTNALAAAEKENFAAALVDIKMPDITGIDVLKVLKGNKPDMVVIMMTGFSETEYAINALNAGASAYLLKPANIEQIKTLLKQAIEHQRLIEENRAMSAALMEWKETLEEKVNARTEELAEANKQTVSLYDELKRNFTATLEVLSIAIDQRDPLTASHSFRVTEYAQELGKVMSLSNSDLEKLRLAGLLHDLGKIEVNEKVLRKEGSLTTEEYQHIQSHAHGTFELLSRFRFKNDLKDVPMIASSHHERFDGHGYPRGLKGNDIPFLARLIAVADVLDAITSRRHYRNAMTLQNALAIFKREAGGHFDPQCVEALFRLNAATFIKIHMSEHLDKLATRDLIPLNNVTLDMLYNTCEAQEATPAQITNLKNFYKYYQGPVPEKFVGQIEPAPKLEDPAPPPNC